MQRYRYIIGLVFFALACCFAFPPTDWTPTASAQMEVDNSSTDAGGGKAAGDPDMPDTQPPPSGTDTYGRGYGNYGGSNSFGVGRDDVNRIGSSSISQLTLADWWRLGWYGLRVQIGWF